MCKFTKNSQELSLRGADVSYTQLSPFLHSSLESVQGKNGIACRIVLKYNGYKAKSFGQKDETT